MHTIKPCCQRDWLIDGSIGRNDRICFIFGQGSCRSFYDIPYIQLYVHLVRKLNSTNYIELRRVYRRMVDPDPMSELSDTRLINLNMIHNDRTTDKSDSRSIPSEIHHNYADTARLRLIPPEMREMPGLKDASTSWTRILKFPTQTLAYLDKNSSKKKMDNVEGV